MDVQTRVGMPLDEFIREYDKAPFELIDGERIPLVPPVAIHVLVLKIIYRALLAYEETSGVGFVFSEASFVLTDTSDWVKGSRVPDAMFYLAERWADYIKDVPDYLSKPFILVPDLCIEVISPTDVYVDVEGKVERYLNDGVHMVWVINPRQKVIAVHTPDRSQITRLTINDTLESDLLPDFRLPVSTLFPA